LKFWIGEVREDNKLGGYQAISTFVAVAVVSWTASSITWSEITRYTLPFAWFTWTWTVISVVAWLFHPYYTIVCEERNRITISSRTLNCGVATFLKCFWVPWIVIALVTSQNSICNENGINQNILIMWILIMISSWINIRLFWRQVASFYRLGLQSRSSPAGSSKEVLLNYRKLETGKYGRHQSYSDYFLLKLWIKEVREDNKLGGYQTNSTFVAVVGWTASCITWFEITLYTLPFAWFTWTWTVILVVTWLFHPYYTIVCDERNRITISSRTLNCSVTTFLTCFWEAWIVIA
jgi:hypothetical protein